MGQLGQLEPPTFHADITLYVALLYSLLYYTVIISKYHDSPKHNPIKHINPQSYNL